MLLFLALAACKKPELSTFTVTPDNLEFSGEAGTQTLKITAPAAWTLSQETGRNWCVPNKTQGKGGNGNSFVTISVTANKPEERCTELVFSSAGQNVSVTVTQAPGTAGDTPEIDITSLKDGVSIYPEVLDADEAAVIYFKAASDSPLHGHTGDIYAHIGVVDSYGDWKFVPADWGENIDKCKMKVEASNMWSLALVPSIREWFCSGETAVNKIGVVIRNADGSLKGVEANTYFDGIVDNKYEEEKFEPDPLVTQRLPEGLNYGINYGSNEVTLVLYDQDTAKKSHKYCYVVGDWNNWERVTEGCMKWDGSKGVWWLTISGLDPDKEYRFQYRLGNSSGADTFISDPYTEIVYDQWNDQYLSGVPAFPEGARDLVSAFRINKPSYNWKHKDFSIEDKNDLIIYELLLRDFSTTKELAGAMACLDYIQTLGVNAIELMPIQEFDGNLSWGYNPNHYFALDKAYGTREQYKDFIDECHGRGIAVLVDVVYNHTTGSHPWAKMWWDGSATAANNPWYNVSAPHPFSVFHDFNHENRMVRDHVKQSLIYLLEEYDVDGFRFDLSKGFTQTYSGEDAGKWSKYDASRIAILKDYYNTVHTANSNAVMILEHLGESQEENELAQAGMQLWRNCNYAYRSTMSGSCDFGGVYVSSPFGGFVSYMESHDEERICAGVTSGNDGVKWGICGTLTSWGEKDDISMTHDGVFFVAKDVEFAADDMFKIRGNSAWEDAHNFGAASKGQKLPLDKEFTLTKGSDSKDMAVPAAGKYDIYFCPEVEKLWLMTPGKRPTEPQLEDKGDVLKQAMQRAGACAAFFLTVPGPKMIWQFGEIGYDISGGNGDTSEKPVMTDSYLQNEHRKKLYDTYSALIRFRKENPRFFDKDAVFSMGTCTNGRLIKCSVDGKAFAVIGNFGSSAQNVTATLPVGGTWKDYSAFGNGIYTTGANNTLTLRLESGEFKLIVKE